MTLGDLSNAELEELGIDPPSGMVEAYRNDETTITIMVLDEDGSDILDNPRDDHSGEDAWEWIEWDNGEQRNRWIADNFCCQECGASPEDEPCPSGYEETDRHIYPDAFRPGLDFWIERYEHSLVRYAPTGESSFFDRQWDVAPGVAIMRFTKPETIGPDDDPDRLLNFARGVCDEYTAWCNGDIYLMLRYELQPPAGATSTPLLTPDDFESEWVRTDVVGGFIGYETAEEVAKTGDY